MKSAITILLFIAYISLLTILTMYKQTFILMLIAGFLGGFVIGYLVDNI